MLRVLRRNPAHEQEFQRNRSAVGPPTIRRILDTIASRLPAHRSDRDARRRTIKPTLALVGCLAFLAAPTIQRRQQPNCKVCGDQQRACMRNYSAPTCKTEYQMCMKSCRRNSLLCRLGLKVGETARQPIATDRRTHVNAEHQPASCRIFMITFRRAHWRVPSAKSAAPLIASIPYRSLRE